MKHFTLFALLFTLASTALAGPIKGKQSDTRAQPTHVPQAYLTLQSSPPPPANNDSTHHHSPLQVFVQGMFDWIYGSNHQETAPAVEE
jgi:hypothetical protein